MAHDIVDKQCRVCDKQFYVFSDASAINADDVEYCPLCGEPLTESGELVIDDDEEEFDWRD